MRKQRGITLIALVITIIVLLILAGISIQSIMGDNSLLTKASNAKQKTAIAQEIEQVQFSYSECKTDNMIEEDGEEVTSEQLQNVMDEKYGSGTVEVTYYNSKLIVTYLKTGRSYEIDLENGTVMETLDWEKIFENATKHPDQTENGDIGIAENGTAVNLDLWTYTLLGNGVEYTLGTGSYCMTCAAYSMDDIVDGKIQGLMPMYIKEEGSDEFYPVTEMAAAFYYNTALVEAPKIPPTMRNIETAFYGCTNLKYVPDLPDSVENLWWTFRYCESLEVAPKLSKNAGCLQYTFMECTNLKTPAPFIPETAYDIERIYGECPNLSGTIEINIQGEWNKYRHRLAFYDSVTEPGCELIITGSCPFLDKIMEDHASNPNIKLGN